MEGCHLFSEGNIRPLRSLRSVLDLKEPSRPSGYRYIVYDKREKNARSPYSLSITIATRKVRSKGFPTAEQAAESAVAMFRRWVAEYDEATSMSSAHIMLSLATSLPCSPQRTGDCEPAASGTHPDGDGMNDDGVDGNIDSGAWEAKHYFPRTHAQRHTYTHTHTMTPCS
jgi:hypothetical protein